MKVILTLIFMIGCATNKIKKDPRPESLEIGMSKHQVEAYFNKYPVYSVPTKDGYLTAYEKARGFNDKYHHICKFDKEGKLTGVEVRKQISPARNNGGVFIMPQNLASDIAEPAMREQRVIEQMNQQAHEFNMMQMQKQQTCTSQPDGLGGYNTQCY